MVNGAIARSAFCNENTSALSHNSSNHFYIVTDSQTISGITVIGEAQRLLIINFFRFRFVMIFCRTLLGYGLITTVFGNAVRTRGNSV